MKKTIYKRAAKSKGKRKYAAAANPYGPSPMLYRRMPETKQADIALTDQVISTTFAATLLNDLQQGTDISQRVGRSISLKSISVRGTIVLTAAGVTARTADYLRIVLVYDRENDGGIGWSDCFQNITTAAATSSDAYSFANSGNWDRFKILKDIKIPMQTGNVLANDVTDFPHDLNINFHVKLNGLETRFVAASNVPASGRLLLLTLGTVVAATAPYQFRFVSRVNYTDM